MTLYGHDYDDLGDPHTASLLAVECLCLIVLVASLGACIRSKWTYNNGSDRLRTILVPLAIVAWIIYVATSIAITVHPRFTDRYYVEFIFLNLGSRVCEICQAVLISKIGLEQLMLRNQSATSRTLLKNISITLVTIASGFNFTCLVMSIVSSAEEAAGDDDLGGTDNLFVRAGEYMSFAGCIALLLLALILLGVTIAKAGSRIHPRGTRTLILVLLFTFLVVRVFITVDDTLPWSQRVRYSYGYYYIFSYAAMIVITLLTTILLAIAATLGIRKYRQSLGPLDSNDYNEPPPQYSQVDNPEVELQGYSKPGEIRGSYRPVNSGHHIPG